MGEAARPKPIDHRPRLIPIVADNQAAEQRTVVIGECRRGTFNCPAHAVRCDSNRTALINVACPDKVEFANDVLPRNSTSPLRIELCAPATHRNPLPTAPVTDTELLGSTP
jgi:hypothetical protein